MEEVRVDDVRELILSLLEQKNYLAIRRELLAMYPVDIAEILEELTKEEYILLFRLLNKDQAAQVFSYLGSQHQREVVSGLHQSRLKYILDELYFDDKIDFLEELPANFAKSLIAYASVEERQLINQFLNYPENSAGSLMTIEYVALKKSMSVKESMARIKRDGTDKETIYTCYVTDETRQLQGIVTLKRLVLSNEDEKVEDIMSTDVVLVHTTTDQEEVAELFKKYDLMAIPVVDGEHRMVGIITIDDIIDVIDRENTEDFRKMAAISPSDIEYLDTGIFTHVRQRLPWLLVLMISATFTESIIEKFEHIISTVVVLAAAIPMLMDSGGNAGAQSSTLIIRSLSLGEVSSKDWLKVLLKELRIGFLVGFMLALVNICRMAVMGTTWAIGLTVSLTLALTILCAKLIGGILPIAAKKLKLDPAIMASPLITTIVDAMSLLIYFTIASILVL